MKNHPAILITLLSLTSFYSPAQVLSDESLSSKCYSTEGDSLSLREVLSQAENEVVFVDLWASWCKDCIVGFPKVKKLQKEYGDISFLFLSVDKKPEEWTTGIDRFKLKGIHYRLENGWKSMFCSEIELDWIPRYIIVDRSGNILHHKSILADDETLISMLDELSEK